MSSSLKDDILRAVAESKSIKQHKKGRYIVRKCKYFCKAPKGYKCLCTKCGGFRVRCSLERCPHFKPSLWGRILGMKKR